MAQHKWHKEIKAWADGAEIQCRRYCIDEEWNDTNPVWADLYEYRIKPSAKCITKDCMNHTNEGKFIGDLCAPCWDYITNGKGVHSQAYRNAHPKEPQYLYVYSSDMGEPRFFWSEITPLKTDLTYQGRIKLEVDDD